MWRIIIGVDIINRIIINIIIAVLIFSCGGISKINKKYKREMESIINVKTQHWNTNEDSLNFYIHISIPIKNMFPNNWLYSRIPKKIITSGEAISEVVKSVPGVNPGNVKSVSAGVDFRRFDFKINGIKVFVGFGDRPPKLGSSIAFDNQSKALNEIYVMAASKSIFYKTITKLCFFERNIK